MRKLLAFIAIGSITAIAFALAASVEFTKFRPEAEWARSRAALLRLHTAKFDAGLHWNVAGASTTAYAKGQVRREGTAIDRTAAFRTVSIGEAGEYADLSGETRSIGGTTYLTYAPPGPVGAPVPFAQAGTWVSLDAPAQAAWGPAVPLSVPVFSEAPAASPWTADSVTNVLTLVGATDVLRFSPGFRPSEVRGVPVRVLDARVDRDAAFAWLLALVRAREQREPTAAERVQATREADLLDGMYVRLWVGKDDHLPHRVNAVGWLPGDARDVMDLRLDLSGFDAPFDGTVPPGAVAYRPALALGADRLEGDAHFPSLGAQQAAAARLPTFTFGTADDPDGDGLDAILETFFGTSPSKADTDGDGVNDGDEVDAGRNPNGNGSLFGFGLD